MNPCAIGKDQVNNVSAIRRVQAKLGIEADGWPGDQTWLSIQQALGISLPKKPSNSMFPNEDYQSMVNFYGQPGDESNLVKFHFPYKTYLYTRRPGNELTSHRCHKKVKDSLEAVLEYLNSTFGYSWIQAHDLDLYFGCYSNRNTRGGNTKSKHSWGVAIDLAANTNGLHTPWPSVATMPIEAVEAFELFGWKSYARVIGRDAMHFEATS